MKVLISEEIMSEGRMSFRRMPFGRMSLTIFHQRSSNCEVGIKLKVFQLRSRNKIFDFPITQFL